MTDKRRGCRFVILLLALLLCSSPCSAVMAEGESAGAQMSAEYIIDGVLGLHGVGDIADAQAWVDGELAASAGAGAEWYILAIAQYTDCELSGYEAALLRYLEEHEVASASSRLKYALCLAACGSVDGYIPYALDASVGEQGIMSLIFGLHLLNNGYVSRRYTLSELSDAILEAQLEGGGWSLVGERGDVDVTAMAVQALAVQYPDSSDIRAAVERALSFLSEAQLEDGGFASYGVPNSESAAQVLVALSALGISPSEDVRFIKNGRSVLDSMLSYRLPDGSFSHIASGGSDKAATEQCFYAAVACVRAARGVGSLYMLDRARASEVRSADSASVWQAPSTASEPQEDGGGLDARAIVSITAVLLGAVACVLLLRSRKRSKKDIIAVVAAVALVVGCAYGLDIRSVDGYYGDASEKKDVIGTVTVAVYCDTVAGCAEHIPADGVILDVSEVDICEDDTVYTVLAEVLRAHRIQLDSSGSSSEVYVRGIAGIYEFDFGAGSGWMYYVNGISPSVSAGRYELEPGERVVWRYSRELGDDLAGEEGVE